MSGLKSHPTNMKWLYT